GVAVGTGVSAVASDRSPERAERERRPRESYSDRLGRELLLTQVQRDSVTRIIDGYQDSMSTMWESLRPRTDSIRTAIRQNIMDLLDDTQQDRYRAYMHRTDSVRAAREAGGHRGSR
ncbi:MAG: hypothetical protein OEY20_02665, partial [Gemmatimonadota bacterium]|nr:hypothetical protein [Gemmatimonadota bacterium]